MIADSIAVLGAGSWGTALALQLARNGHAVRLWGHDSNHIATLQGERRNRRHLPECGPFPDMLSATSELEPIVRDSAITLLVVPSHAFAATLSRLRPALAARAQNAQAPAFAWATKGLERGSGRFLHQLVNETLADIAPCPTAVISGPNFAGEVARGLPTAITVASDDPQFAHRLASLLDGSAMLVYTSNDVPGVELGGAVKNVLAVAAGIADGLGFGANARAALITRGLAELQRLGQALGVRRETLMGLTGVGDLVLTCTDDQSRNRRFGLAIGAGQSPEQAQQAIGQTVEGAFAAREITALACRHGVAMPICEQVEQVLFRGLAPRQAVENLLARPPRPEHD